jgi:biopolymer transport protein ExbB/TolQ
MNKKLIVGLIVGIVLALGPIWGMIGTVVGMVFAFGTLAQQQPQVEVLAGNMSLALFATVAGCIACPIGIVIIIVAAIKLGKDREATVGSNQALPATFASREG